MLIIILALITIAVIGVGTFVFVQKQQQQTDSSSAESLNRRISILQDGFADQGLLEARESKESFMESLNKDIMNLIGSFTPAASPEKLDQLNKAGLRTPDAHVAIFFQQISGAVFGLVLGLVIMFTGIGIMAALAIGLGLCVLLYMGPSSNVRKLIKDRAYKIDKTIPDMIDLFANCCVAGVSFDIAAGYILPDLGNEEVIVPIKEDFLAWQADVNLGMERPDSWKRLANRSESKSIRYFTSLMNQSEKTGGSVADALFKMSSFFRERRKQQLETEIAQLPTKMSSQTIAFIVLPIVILLLGPVGLNAFKMMSDLFGGR
jgi:tight adherence protein C